MKNINKPNVGLDSQCLSYLLDGIKGIKEPTDPLAAERKALLRSWFYMPGTFILTETVIAEVSKIKKVSRREFHESFINTLFLDYPARDLTTVKTRAAQFEIKHPKKNDCLILAESEELGLDFVLTYDDKFWKRLNNASNITKLMRPTEYWAQLEMDNWGQIQNKFL